MDKDCRIKGHDKSITHKTYMSKWDGYKQSMKTTSIQTQLNVVNEALIRENRNYIYNIAEILLYTSCQNIAQRGHDESKRRINKGNFLELLELYV